MVLELSTQIDRKAGDDIVKAVILNEFGGPEKLQIQEVPNPEPGKGEVRIRIKAIGLNRAEVAARVGKYPLAKELPIRLGFEGSGLADKTGDGVSEVAEGDRVSIIPTGRLYAEQGSYAEYANVPVNALTKTPENLTDIESAATWMAYLTVWASLVKQTGIRAGDFVIVTAASSSLGGPALQVCKHEGAHAIATTRSSDKIDAIKALGYEHVIDTSSENLVSRVKDITGGRGANVAFDCVGGPAMKNLIKSLGFRGKILSYGMLDSRPMEITPMHLMPKEITLLTHMVFHWMEDLAIRKEGVMYVTRGVTSGAFKPKVAKTFPFDKISDAHSFMQSNQQIGKIVVTV